MAGTVVAMAQAGTVPILAAVVVMVAADVGAAMGADGWITHRAIEAMLQLSPSVLRELTGREASSRPSPTRPTWSLRPLTSPLCSNPGSNFALQAVWCRCESGEHGRRR